MKRTLKSALSCLALLLSFPVVAEIQYWVSVGSYQSQSNADKAAQAAFNSLGEPFSTIGVSTASGYFHRVAIGPFLSRELADDRVRSARSAGFEGAWLWADQAGVFAQASAVSEFSSSLSEFDSGEYDLDPLPDYDVDLYSEDYERQLSPADAVLKARSEQVPVLVEEAPEGYSLNRLRRGV